MNNKHHGDGWREKSVRCLCRAGPHTNTHDTITTAATTTTTPLVRRSTSHFHPDMRVPLELLTTPPNVHMY
ncbi:hypothetical protein E2C01_075652 [Portunus trituberculatus]|uniref:Uncharacterized protein n=1 Tax=Portunus trituberculatus TaxID=210409 RepID=A0A5B7IB87_PORTR|nr:hypothetical protein [Portunus trituberculatus]